MTDGWNDAAWGQHLVAELAEQRDLALARKNRLSGAPILPPRFPPLNRHSCVRCGRRSGSKSCPECGAPMASVSA